MVRQQELINDFEEPRQPLSMNPQKFALWLFILTIIMIFAALTSAYIVREADGNWLEFDLPMVLWVNTFMLFASSVTMHLALRAAKKDNLSSLKTYLILTTVLGVVFLVGQFISWNNLVEANVFFVGNPSGSFLYVLTGVHGFHLVSGIIFLLIVLISSFQYKIHSKNLNRIEMCATYWHFLDGLWIYLFIFLIVSH